MQRSWHLLDQDGHKQAA